MRISCIQSDPGYKEWTNILSTGKNVEVFLNGVLMENVVMADDQKDEIVCHAMPLCVDPATDELALETYYGRVSIEITDPVPVPDTFQVTMVKVKEVDFQDDPGDCDMLPSDVFCWKDHNGAIVSQIVVNGQTGLVEVPEFEFKVEFYGTEVNEFGHLYFEEPDDGVFIIFDEFSDIEDAIDRAK